MKTNETNVDSPSKISQSKSPDIHNITSKVNGSYQPGDFKEVPGFRVSQMVQDYNIRDQAQNPYLSDSEIYTKPKQLRAVVAPESRGGGFKDQRPKWKEATKANAMTNLNNAG
jgi:hypothetical protein